MSDIDTSTEAEDDVEFCNICYAVDCGCLHQRNADELEQVREERDQALARERALLDSNQEARDFLKERDEARNAALEEAKRAAVVPCYETRHVTLGDKVADAIEALKSSPAPMRCAECDCEKGGEDCNWIASTPRHQDDDLDMTFMNIPIYNSVVFSVQSFPSVIYSDPREEAVMVPAQDAPRPSVQEAAKVLLEAIPSINEHNAWSRADTVMSTPMADAADVVLAALRALAQKEEG